MKCIKSLKSFGTTKVGEVIRVDDNSANEKVTNGGWKYVPKSEWKTSNTTGKKNEIIQDENKTTEETITSKKPKFKKGKTNKK
jgi:hypothetical protein